MLKKSHRSLAVSLTPLFLIPIENINSPFLGEFINKLIINQHFFINYILNINNILFSLLSFIIYLYASTFPDYDRYLKIFYSNENKNKRYLYHRQITHSLLLFIIIFSYSLYNIQNTEYYIFLYTFSLGILTHIIGDILTGSVPILFYSPYYIRFGRIGITTFLPHSLHKIFTEKFPKYLNKHYKKIFFIIFIINLIIYNIFVKIINI
jgi:uncharacterized integral membrane protein